MSGITPDQDAFERTEASVLAFERAASQGELPLDIPEDSTTSRVLGVVVSEISGGFYEVRQLMLNDTGTEDTGKLYAPLEFDETTDGIGYAYELNGATGVTVGKLIVLFSTGLDTGGFNNNQTLWVFNSGAASETPVGSGGNAGNCEIIYGVTKATKDANVDATNVTFGDLTCYKVVTCPDPCFGFSCANNDPSLALTIFKADYVGATKRWLGKLFTQTDIQLGNKICQCADTWTDSPTAQQWHRTSATAGGVLLITRTNGVGIGGKIRFEADNSGTVESFTHNLSGTSCGIFAGSPVCNAGAPPPLTLPDSYFLSYTQNGFVYTWERGGDWGC